MSNRYGIAACAEGRLRAAGIDSARADARILIEHARGDATLLERSLSRREQYEPVAYIIGHKEFWSLEFEVGRGVLVPRPETETLIEEALREFPVRTAPLQFLDLGAGSGCVLVAALSEYPNAFGTAVESSFDAIAWLRKNIANHRMEDRCVIRLDDWAGISGQFDAIFSNPPYVSASEMAKLPPDVVRYEPESALIAGADGLAAFRDLAPHIAKCLKPDGKVFLELGRGQAPMVSAILQSAGLEVARIATDLAGIERCVVAARAA